MPVESRIAMMIPMVSKNPLPTITDTIAEIATAKSRILMMGSSNFLIYCRHKGSLTGGVMTFVPNVLRNSGTWAVVSPESPARFLISSNVSIIF